MFDRFSDNAKQLMSLARKAVQRHRSGALEPEHVLVAILELPTCNAGRLLAEFGLDLASLHQALDTMLLPASAEQSLPPGQVPFTPASKRMLELALQGAASLGHAYIGSQHLLLGMLGVASSSAAQVLRRTGVDEGRVREALAETAPAANQDRRRLLLISNSTMHGGGYLAHCRHELENFLGARRKVMFVPYALHDHAGYTAKAREAFATIGHEVVSVHEHNHAPALVDAVDAVFVGGGNTFRLLSALQHYELLPAIRRRVLAGMPYIGSSAGTNVATLSIRTTNDMPIVQPQSFAALQLVPFQINPHYLDPDPKSRHMGETREERIRQFHEEHEVPVLGLREGCMLRVEGMRMELRGTTPARLFRRGATPVEFAPPCDLSFLLEA